MTLIIIIIIIVIPHFLHLDFENVQPYCNLKFEIRVARGGKLENFNNK